MKKILIHTVCYIVVAGCSFWSGALTRDYLVTREARERRERPARFVSKPAPQISSLTIDTEKWSLSDHRGKVVVIECWATWCGPCIAALPKFQKLHERFAGRSDFALVGVSLDDDLSAAKEFCEKHAITWTQLIEPGKTWNNSVAKALDVKEVPFFCVVDKRGVIRSYDGYSQDKGPPDLESLVQRLVEETVAPAQIAKAP